MPTESTPLLSTPSIPSDPYSQFCFLIGLPTPGTKKPRPGTLFYRASKRHTSQHYTYTFTAALSNTLLLTQVVLGATLTALGASSSSHILITLFGVINTIIAGLVAYLKSRGQPMRARMFRDDLENVVDEIENSKTMWLGITRDVHGYDEIDIDDKVSVRGEVARLTRLYEQAVKKYMANNPDMYNAGGGMMDPITGLRGRPAGAAAAGGEGAHPGAAAPAPAAVGEGPAGAAAGVGAQGAVIPPAAVEPVEESPATAKDPDKIAEDKGKKDDDVKKEEDTAKAKDADKPAAETNGDSKTEQKTTATSSPPSKSDTPAPDTPVAKKAESTPTPPPASALVTAAAAAAEDEDASPATASNASLHKDKDKKPERKRWKRKDKTDGAEESDDEDDGGEDAKAGGKHTDDGDGNGNGDLGQHDRV